jgi:hypothetical protein
MLLDGAAGEFGSYMTQRTVLAMESLELGQDDVAQSESSPPLI